MSLGAEYSHLKKEHEVLVKKYDTLHYQVRNMRKAQKKYTDQGGTERLNLKIETEKEVDLIVGIE